MRYMFLIYDNEDEWEAAPESEKVQVIGAHMAYRTALDGAGALVYGAPLEHSRSSARVRKGKVEDGPFTDSKEQIGGFYVIEAADLDAALDWAARCPSAEYGRIEVRPVWNIPAEPMSEARGLAEEAARASYGRLLAWTAARTRDIAEAEDALADAFAAALETWPIRGVPLAPDAWLLEVARRKLIDRARRIKTRRDAEPAMLLAAEEAAAALENRQFPDERLKLLFICAHPAIDEGVRTPLMLQTVLGLDAGRIASAFIVAPATMSQRLVRAKRKIKEARLRFEPPGPEALPERLVAVLDAIYAAFNAGWEHEGGADPAGLAAEAIFLGRLVAGLLPKEPEALGLVALMLFAHARRAARRLGGRYVALDDQDTALWDRTLIEEAELLLRDAARHRRRGRFQIEAAIQSAHTGGRLFGQDTRDAIVALYERLMEIAPSLGAEVGRIAALSKAGRDAEALAALDALGPAAAARYQPYWATRAHVLTRLHRLEEARSAYTRAIGLSADPAVRNFLDARLQALS